jgi:hypothetical protein
MITGLIVAGHSSLPELPVKGPVRMPEVSLSLFVR